MSGMTLQLHWLRECRSLSRAKVWRVRRRCTMESSDSSVTTLQAVVVVNVEKVMK